MRTRPLIHRNHSEGGAPTPEKPLSQMLRESAAQAKEFHSSYVPLLEQAASDLENLQSRLDKSDRMNAVYRSFAKLFPKLSQKGTQARLDIIVDHLRESFGVERTRVYLLQYRQAGEGEEEFMQCVAASEAGSGKLDPSKFSLLQRPQAQEELGSYWYLTPTEGATMCVRSIQDDPLIPFEAKARMQDELGTNSAFIIPLEHDGSLIGCIILDNKTQNGDSSRPLPEWLNDPDVQHIISMRAIHLADSLQHSRDSDEKQNEASAAAATNLHNEKLVLTLEDMVTNFAPTAIQHAKAALSTLERIIRRIGRKNKVLLAPLGSMKKSLNAIIALAESARSKSGELASMPNGAMPKSQRIYFQNDFKSWELFNRLALGRCNIGLTLEICDSLNGASANFSSQLLFNKTIQNIMHTAATYCHASHVTISARRDGDIASISVAANGDALSHQIAGNLFIPEFASANEGPVNMHNSLHDARALLRQAGGDLALESRQGETIFKITLPLIKEEAQTDAQQTAV